MQEFGAYLESVAFAEKVERLQNSLPATAVATTYYTLYVIRG